MITAETVNGIVRFQANGLPVVSLYCRVDPGASQREVRARVDSLQAKLHFCRVAGTFSADPAATPVAEIRRSAQGVVQRYQHARDGHGGKPPAGLSVTVRAGPGGIR